MRIISIPFQFNPSKALQISKNIGQVPPPYFMQNIQQDDNIYSQISRELETFFKSPMGDVKIYQQTLNNICEIILYNKDVSIDGTYIITMCQKKLVTMKDTSTYHIDIVLMSDILDAIYKNGINVNNEVLEEIKAKAEEVKCDLIALKIQTYIDLNN